VLQRGLSLQEGPLMGLETHFLSPFCKVQAKRKGIKKDLTINRNNNNGQV